VIGLARERFTKNLRSDRSGGGKPCLMTVQDDAAQAECIVTAILENREAGTALKEQQGDRASSGCRVQQLSARFFAPAGAVAKALYWGARVG
jgi:hypothetical protein